MALVIRTAATPEDQVLAAVLNEINGNLDDQNIKRHSLDLERVMRPGTLDGSLIAADSITATQIAPDAVGSSELAPNAVTAVELADNSVDNAAMADNAVGNAEMADDAVGMVELKAEVDDALADWSMFIPLLNPATTVGAWVQNMANDVAYQVEFTSTGAQNDELVFPVALSAGTWRIRMQHTRDNNRGIYDFQLDGSSVGTIDGYNAARAVVTHDVSGIAVATTGKKNLKVKMGTKNGASFGYFGVISAISLVRTA